MTAKQVLRPMQVRIPETARTWLQAQAKAEDRSMNYVLIKVLEQAQRRQEQSQAN